MAMQDVIALILGGGRGARLYPLTKLRAKPAVPVGGKYRLIDVPISNCLNSGVQKIYVLTQFLSESLHRHIYQTYRFDLFSGGFVYILAAEETPSGIDWYHGTADAVRKQLPRFVYSRAKDVLILSGDHLYRMNYANFIAFHREKRADITIAAKPVSLNDAPRYGILKTDEDHRVTSFCEKPTPDKLEGLEYRVGSDRSYLASMGIYAFRHDVLQKVLEKSDAEDFGKEVIPAAVENLRVYAYLFNGYWEDIGTLRSFYEANLLLTRPDPPFDFHDPRYPMYACPCFLPYSRIEGCRLERAVVAEGCLLRDSEIRESVIGVRSIIGPDVRLTRTVMMGADTYETPERKAENRRLGQPDIGIARGCTIEGAIIDKNARIGEGVTIRPHPEDEVIETENYVIRDGIVVVLRDAVIPDGTVI